MKPIQYAYPTFQLYAQYHLGLCITQGSNWIFFSIDMKVVQAFPCRCRFADKENALKVEEEVGKLMLFMET